MKGHLMTVTLVRTVRRLITFDWRLGGVPLSGTLIGVSRGVSRESLAGVARGIPRGGLAGVPRGVPRGGLAGVARGGLAGVARGEARGGFDGVAFAGVFPILRLTQEIDLHN